MGPFFSTLLISLSVRWYKFGYELSRINVRSRHVAREKCSVQQDHPGSASGSIVLSNLVDDVAEI